MSQPPAYTPAADFSDDERDNVGGRSTVRTAALNAELSAIKATLDETLVNLSLNQRDDGEIRDGRVKLFTLAANVLALLTAYGATPRGPWVTATAYALKDLVSQSGNTYIAVMAHASGVFATDLAAGKWLLFSLGAAAGATQVTFTPTTTVSSTNVQAAIQEVDAEYRAGDVALAGLIAASNTARTQLIADLASTSTANIGAGMVGLGALEYLKDTVGGAVFTTIWGDGATDKSAALASANALGHPIRVKGVLVIGSPTTIAVPIVDTMARIFSDASQVTIDNGLPVRAEWFGSTAGYGDRAVNALPALGGTVLFSTNSSAKAFSHAYNGGYLSKSNVTLRGQKMPQLADNCRSLTGGTILRGMLQVYADNFEIRDIGIDMGKTVLDALYGGATAPGVTEAAVFTYPSDSIKAASPLKRGVKWHNVIALGPAPSSPTHALILGEGATDVSCTGQVIGAMAGHSVVLKCANVKAEQLYGYLSNIDGLIIKTDAQATAIARDIQIDSLVLRAQGPDGVTPYVAAVPAAGLLFECSAGSIDKVQIDEASVVGYPNPVKNTFGGNFILSGVNIDSLMTDQFGLSGTLYGLEIASGAGQSIRRITIGTLEARFATAAARFAFAQSGTLQNHVSVGRIYATSMTSVAVDIASQSYVDIGSVVTDACADAVYRITGTPKVSVGQLFRDTATPNVYSTSGGGLAPALLGTWSQGAGSDPWGVDLLGGKVSLRGLIVPGANNQALQLPQWARPLTVKRFSAQGNNGAQTAVPVTVRTDGVVLVNEIATGVANCTTWLSLSGISYDLQA